MPYCNLLCCVWLTFLGVLLFSDGNGRGMDLGQRGSVVVGTGKSEERGNRGPDVMFERRITNGHIKCCDVYWHWGLLCWLSSEEKKQCTILRMEPFHHEHTEKSTEKMALPHVIATYL